MSTEQEEPPQKDFQKRKKNKNERAEIINSIKKKIEEIALKIE